jgi:hypothetical protein
VFPQILYPWISQSFAFAPNESIITHSFQLMTQNHETVIILDFGSQYTQLIARRVREAGVYCEILPFNTPIEAINAKSPKGLIFSGGPSSVYDKTRPNRIRNCSNLSIVPRSAFVTGFRSSRASSAATVARRQIASLVTRD